MKEQHIIFGGALDLLNTLDYLYACDFKTHKNILKEGGGNIKYTDIRKSTIYHFVRLSSANSL
jgi:hypothetical protein